MITDEVLGPYVHEGEIPEQKNYDDGIVVIHDVSASTGDNDTDAKCQIVTVGGKYLYIRVAVTCNGKLSNNFEDQVQINPYIVGYDEPTDYELVSACINSSSSTNVSGYASFNRGELTINYKIVGSAVDNGTISFIVMATI